MSDVPRPRDCETCLSEITRLHGADGDLAEALSTMSPGDAEDVLILAEAVAEGRVASDRTPPTCASCGAVYGIRRD